MIGAGGRERGTVLRRAVRWGGRTTVRALSAMLEPLALLLLRPANRRRARRAPAATARKVVFLVQHAYGAGGTVRSVLNCAGQLARQREVEVVGLIRELRRPSFPIPEGVRVSSLDDRVEPPGGARGLARRVLSRLPSLLVPVGEPSYRRCSLWTDLLLIRFLRSLRTGLLITTRPSLNLAAAVFAPPEVRTVGQEHMNLGSHRPAVRDRVLRRYGRLDAVVTLTATDLAGYRRELPDARRLVCIPNALPELAGGPADPAARTVLAAGRLVRQKGFDLLLDAWEQVVADHPGWTLRIYGGGPWRQRLQRRIDRRGLSSSAFLMGRTGDIGTAMAKASIFVLSSRYEGLPLVLLEAMSKGLGVVSFDCPTGPRELLTDSVDGLLVKDGDVPALASAIGRMMDDQGLRARLGEQAIGAMARYTPEAVGAEWEALLDDLVRPAPARRPARPRVPEQEAGLL